MSKHTPGPWICELNDGEYLISGKTEGHQHFTAIARHEPNARLIAAAPDILEALKLCLQAFSPWGTNHPAEAAAKAAIAKATGEST